MSVEESTVIFGPMLQVGWVRASPRSTSARSSASRPRNGPPEAVSTMRSTRRMPSAARRHWWTAQCSLSTGTSSAPGVSRDGAHHGPGGDQRFLVRQREPSSGTQRRHRHRQAGEADHTVDRDLGLDGERRQRLGPGDDVDAGIEQRLELGGSSGVGDADHPWPDRVGLRCELSHGGGGGERNDLELVGLRCDDLERLGADGAGGAENGDRDHATVIVPSSAAGGPRSPALPRCPLRRRRCSRCRRAPSRSTRPAGRTATHRSGRARHRGRAAPIPCP